MARTQLAASPTPSGEGAASPPAQAPARARRWPRRLLIAANVFIALCLVAAGAAYAYVSWRFSQIHRVGIGSLVHEAAGLPQTVLIVGSDSRAGESAEDVKHFGPPEVEPRHSDTIMLVHINPATTGASILSIPRDLWVNIPAAKPFHQRINVAYTTGPDLLVRTIEQDLGIDINHYVEVDFNSFRQVTNAVDGVKFYFPTPARDILSGLNITTPGCYGLIGDSALAFVRSRHFEYYTNGRWYHEGFSDLARIRRQQAFVKKMAAKAQATGLTDLGRLNGVISAVVKNLTVDSGLHTREMLSLARRYRHINPDQVPSYTLPALGGDVGGADVLFLKEPEAKATIDAFLGIDQPAAAGGGQDAPSGPPPVFRPADVRLRVFNGSGRSGEAAATSATLRQYGFVVGPTGAGVVSGAPDSVVRYAAGAEAKARFVAAMVIGGASLQPDPELVGYDLTLTTGTSFGGLRAPGSTPAAAAAVPATTTTTMTLLPGTPTDQLLPPC